MTVLRGLLVTAFAVIGLIGFNASSQAAVGINQQISFQGKLVNSAGNNLPDGTYNLEFKIYQDGTGCIPTGTPPCGGTLKWTESRLVSASQGVTVTAGTFQVNLGSVSSFGALVDWNQDSLWLSMNVGGTASSPSWDGEMKPFIRLTSVPYALNAGRVGGLTASQLVQLTPGSQQSGSINVSGNIMTGGTLQATTIDAATAGTLTVGSTNTTGVTLNKNVTITNGQTLTIGGQQVFSGTGILQAAALSSSVVYSSLTQIGTITTGTWNASVIAPNYGGTGINSYAIGDLLYASGTATMAKLSSPGGNTCLRSTAAATAPSYGSCIAVGGYNAAGTDVNGATFSGNTLTFQSASASAPGMVDTGVQSFAGAKTFNASLQVGSATTDGTIIDFQVDSFNSYNDSGMACSTTNNQGAMYYSTATAAMRACLNGAWEDLLSTGGLGLLTFGVVPDSLNAGSPGELAGIVPSNSPCKVYWSSATTVTVAPCLAYTGGRKVIVSSTVLSVTGMAANTYRNVCLNGANGQPAISAANSATDAGVAQPTWSANNPIVCLATVFAGAANTVTRIYDTRSFTTTGKTFATTNTAVNNGFLVVQAGANLVAPTTTAAFSGIRGVVVAYSGSTSTTTANVIIATSGPQHIKAATGTVATEFQTSSTSGYGQSVSLPSGGLQNLPAPYLVVGTTTRTLDTACNAATNCQYSMFINPMSIR